MDVILTQDVENLGGMGDAVSVAPGYARNFLIPKGMAVVATAGHRKMVAEKMRQAVSRESNLKADAEAVAAKLGELSCTLTVQAGDDDKLYGSVAVRDIVEAFKTQEIELDSQQILLEEPIKQLGVYNVPVKLHAEVQVTAKVWVVKE